MGGVIAIFLFIILVVYLYKYNQNFVPQDPEKWSNLVQAAGRALLA